MESTGQHRHPSLHPLSRHHHHALVTAQKLIRATEETKDDIIDHVKRFWTTDGQNHFREEEEVLLPELAHYLRLEDSPDIITMLIEHVKIRSGINSLLQGEDATVDRLVALGQLLQHHVRKEERIVFPLIESVVPESRLMAISSSFHDPDKSCPR